MENASLSKDVKSSSPSRENFTAQDLQHALYGRNPVRVVHVYETINESKLDTSGEKHQNVLIQPVKRRAKYLIPNALKRVWSVQNVLCVNFWREKYTPNVLGAYYIFFIWRQKNCQKYTPITAICENQQLWLLMRLWFLRAILIAANFRSKSYISNMSKIGDNIRRRFATIVLCASSGDCFWLSLVNKLEAIVV